MLPIWYNRYKKFIEESINNYLDEYFEKNITNPGLMRFKESIYYGVKGGKKIRAILALEFFLSFSGRKFKELKYTDDIIKFCISLELIHAFSLIHDDLPCMDNDEYRRGELTVWKKYSEYEAVLAGDLLNSLTFEILSEISDPQIAIKLINYVSRSIGFYGMLGGQIDDMYFEKNPNELNIDDLLNLHSKKTGALIKASVSGGILLSGFKEKVSIFENFGKKIGLSFQIMDDILDVEGNLKDTGKSVGGEEKGFVHFLGIKKSKEYLNELINESLELIKNLNSKKLDFLVNYIGNRNK